MNRMDVITLYVEHFRSLATIATALIVAIPTLYKFSKTLRGHERKLLAASVAMFLLTVLFANYASMGLSAAAYGMVYEDPGVGIFGNVTGNTGNVGSFIAFHLGIICLTIAGLSILWPFESKDRNG